MTRLICPLVLAAAVIASCDRGGPSSTAPGPDSNPDPGPDDDGEWQVLLSADFENPEDQSAWTGTLIQQPSGQPEAFIVPSSEVAHSGAMSAKMFAPPRMFDPEHDREFCGKAALANGDILVREGDTAEYSAWFYLTDAPSEAFFFLMDVECTEGECGYMGAPGVRLRIPRDAPRLQLEWKFKNWFSQDADADLPPTPPLGSHFLPVEEWFKVTVVARFGRGDAGVTEVYVDDELDSRVVGTNISPGPPLEDMNRYDDFEIGLTCNSSGSRATTIYVDDVLVRTRVGS